MLDESGNGDTGNRDTANGTAALESGGNGHAPSAAIGATPELIDLSPDADRPGLREQQSRALTVNLIAKQPESDPRVPVAKLVGQPGVRLMPHLGLLESEPFWKRAMYLVLAASLLWGYSILLKSYWAPAHPGINQNGYLVGGKLLAETGTMGFKPANPYIYLGWMWNLVERGEGSAKEIWFYPKYPIGTGALFAGMLKLSEWTSKTQTWDQGKIWVFYVNPACAVLALAATFMLLRQFCGSFVALLGTMVLGSCQVLLTFAEQPLSHGPALCAVCWGMYFLLRWWQTGSIWRGVLAGLFLGYAVTIRYTEGLLLLPLGVATLTMIRYDAKSIRWWSLGILLAIGAAGLVANYGLPEKSLAIHLERWVAISLGIAALGISLRPMFFERRLVDVWTHPGLPDATTTVLNYAPPRARSNRIFAYTFHTLRTIIAAVLVYTLIFYQAKKGNGADDVGRLIEDILIKVILAVVVAMLYLTPWSQPRRYLKLAVPIVAWMIPVGILVSYNWLAMHSFTGYDSTNESTAFTWRMFEEKWDDTVQQIHDYSMFLIPPLALAGAFLMYRWNWRAGLLITLWLVPGMVLYTAYYFGKMMPGMWYLRFFLTLFPPMLIAAMWLLRAASDGIRTRFNMEHKGGSLAVPLGLGIFTFCSCAIGLKISIPGMEREAAANLNLAYTCDRIVETINRTKTLIDGKVAKPIVFAEGRSNPNGPMCNFLQFAGDFELYPSDGFGGGGFGGWQTDDPNMPNPLQPDRVKWLKKIFNSKTEADIAKDQAKIIGDAIDGGRQVFAVLQSGGVSSFRNRVVGPTFELKMIASWREPARVAMGRSMGPLDPSSRSMALSWSRASQSWQLYEIKRKPKPAPVPATAPTTAPMTAPTTSPMSQTNPSRMSSTTASSATSILPPTTKPAGVANLVAPTTKPTVLATPAAPAPAVHPTTVPIVQTPSTAPSTQPK